MLEITEFSAVSDSDAIDHTFSFCFEVSNVSANRGRVCLIASRISLFSDCTSESAVGQGVEMERMKELRILMRFSII